MPKRIQLSRRRGWRMPAGAVNVARPTKWGNPFKRGNRILSGSGLSFRDEKLADRAQLVRAFRDMLELTPRNYPTADCIRAELRGKDLACWCPLDQPCHADVLLELANSEVTDG